MATITKRRTPSVVPTDWTEVIAKALAYLAVNSEELKAKRVSQRGAFLISLGLSYADAANLLGSTEASLREMLRAGKKAGKSSRSNRASSKVKASTGSL